MSNWTHVAGVVRIDAIRPLLIDGELDFDKYFGKSCLYRSPIEVWDDMENNPDDYMPCGSEGTLEKSVWVNPDESQMPAYTVSIFGDLRDHDSPEAVVEWFKEKCTTQKLWIRNACIVADNELNGQATWVWSDEDEKEYE